MLLENIRVFISPKEVLRYQGYKEGLHKKSDRINQLLEGVVQEGYRLIRPKALVAMVGVKEVGDTSLRLENGLLLNIENSLKVWKGLEQLAVALCTIGSLLEGRVSELFARGDYAEALMLDSVGTVAVRSVADQVNAHICQTSVAQGMSAGSMLSPGERWDLADQRGLLALLESQTIGVSLTEQCMMVPQKSVSFCVGVGREVAPQRRTHSCERCSLKDCQYRKAEYISA